MIRRLKIKNIQSHKNTEIQFDKGINLIVGSSNNGKSAILRALYWVKYNRPLGVDSLLSHWAYDKKGNQIDSMEVELENDNAVIVRKRTKNENQYIVNDNVLNVVKTDVLLQVERALKLSDTNIQRQQDSPFLLSLTSGQVAQYFNKTVRLDIIDNVLSHAEKERRKTMQDLKNCDETLKELESRKEKYAVIEELEKLYTKYSNVSERLSRCQNAKEQLSQQLDEVNKLNKLVDKLNKVAECKNLVDKYYSQQNALIDIKNRKEVLTNELERFANLKENIYPSFEKQKKLVAKINSFDIEKISKEKLELKESLEYYNFCLESINNSKQEVKRLKKLLPDVCPLCGNVMKGGKRCD